MKTSQVVWKLVVIAFVVVFDPILVQGKRQKPRHDEIERFNDTHSFIWKCSVSECHPGLGLNVQCGTSIPISTRIECVACVKGVNYSDTQDYSTCKSCKNCGKHENKKGECTPEEDRTECLGTCYKGFYMDKITGDCHPCSDCCSMTLAKKHHEKQCEDAGLPPQQQCRQTNIKCHHPSKADSERKDPQPEKQGSLQALEIVLIVFFVTIGVFIIVFLVLWWCYGWEQVKVIFKKCCCCLCHLVQSTGENTFNFCGSDQGDLESAFCNVSGSRLLEDGDVLGTLSSDAFVWTTETLKRPVFQRLLSVPVETQSNFKLKIIPRSFSDPGCLNGLDKTQKMSNFLSGSGNLLLSAGTKKRTKKGYTLVETEPPEIDDLLIGENLGKDISSGELIGNSLQSGDFVAQVPGMETPVPTELPEHDYLPANNLCKDCVLQPTFSGAFPGNPLQSAGPSDEDVFKDQRLEKPSAKDQCTSTTGLHLSSTTQVADIPQDFLDSLLSKSISAIPIKFYRKICNGLDILRQCFWDDYRMLAEKVGLDKDDTLWLGQNGNPTELILQKFNSQKNSSIGRFKEILEQMQRDDIVTIIKEWVVDEWNNNNCGKGYKLKSFV